MSFLISATVLIVVVATPGYTLPNSGTPAPTQYFSCYYDWCEIPWEYCDKEGRRCNPCSLDVCRRQNFPKNCTQACQKLLSPKTTTTTREPEQPQQLQESPQRIEKRLTNLTALVIAVLIVVIIGFSAIGVIIFCTRRKRCSRSRDRDLDSEQAEERKPLQATESGNISQSSDSSSSSPPPGYTTYPEPTPLDKGEPPIIGMVAGDARRPATNAQSSSYSWSGDPAPTSLASSGQNPGQVQSPAHRPGAASLPAPNAGSFDVNSPRMTGNSYPLTTPTSQGVSKLQHQKDLIEDGMDIPNNINQPLLTEDATPDNDDTAPKSNTFGARPVDV